MVYKRPFTVDQHREAGILLRRIHNELIDLAVDISASFTVVSREYKNANRAIKYLNLLKSDLDDSMAKDYPENFSPGVYYGGWADRDTPSGEVHF